MKCPICFKEKLLIEEHHEIPRASGGISGPTIMLCSECHKSIHLCARKILAHKGSEIYEITKSFYNKSLAKDLIKSIVVNSLRKLEGKIPDKELTYTVTLEFPGKIRRFLEILCKDNKQSIKKFLENIILNYINNKFPNNKLR